MTYNWTEIVKKKSLKELYGTMTRVNSLTDEERYAAKMEIENRGYSLNEPQKIKDKIELESLIEERDFERGIFGRLFYSDSILEFKLFLGAAGLTIFAIINLTFNLIKTHWGISLIILCVALFFTFYYYFSYKKKSRREKWRQTRITELEKQ
jgi:hypothetical protein